MFFGDRKPQPALKTNSGNTEESRDIYIQGQKGREVQKTLKRINDLCSPMGDIINFQKNPVSKVDSSTNSLFQKLEKMRASSAQKFTNQKVLPSAQNTGSSSPSKSPILRTQSSQKDEIGPKIEKNSKIDDFGSENSSTTALDLKIYEKLGQCGQISEKEKDE